VLVLAAIGSELLVGLLHCTMPDMGRILARFK